VGAELFHADRETGGRTDGHDEATKLIVGFRNFAQAPKNTLRTYFIILAFVNVGH
jgi:hypothetical protein